MSSFENLLISQTEKQLALLQQQSRNYAEWHEIEHELIDKFIVQENFIESLVSSMWEGAILRYFDSIVEVKGKWKPISDHCGGDGLYLNNRVIRCKESVKLKTLGVEVKIDFRLSANSELWVLTRGSDLNDPGACIIKITKEQDIDGTFIIFGSPIGEDNEFIFFKRQQIPEENFDPEQEFTSIEMRIKDNGDDRVFVTVKLSTLQSTVFQTFCNKFIPSFVENNILLAGFGRNVILKKVSIQQKERTSMGIIIEASKRQQCCLIF